MCKTEISCVWRVSLVLFLEGNPLVLAIIFLLQKQEKGTA